MYCWRRRPSKQRSVALERESIVVPREAIVNAHPFELWSTTRILRQVQRLERAIAFLSKETRTRKLLIEEEAQNGE